MNDESKYIVPRTLDDPAKLFWWDIDQALLVCMFVVFGMSIDHMLAGMLTGGFMGWLYGKSKSGKHKGYAVHLMYWHLPAETFSLKRTPPSHQREMIG